MTLSKKGAWFVFYRLGMTGTKGLALDSDSDNLGWAIHAWKHALAYAGFGGTMNLNSPTIGKQADTQIRAFQKAKGLGSDGVIGPHTGRALVMPYVEAQAQAHSLPLWMPRGVVGHESGFDVGAIGYADQGDRGSTQRHLGSGINISLSQAIRPAWAIPSLASRLANMKSLMDEDGAVASWNCGEAGAEWWFDSGKPDSGSPPWWDEAKYGSLGKRATDYVAAVRAYE